jgi:hypothetical protein
LGEPRLSLYHNEGLAGITRETLELAVPTEAAGVFALALNYTHYGDLDGYDDLGTATAPFRPHRFGLALGWGFRLSPDLSIGLGFRDFFESLGPGQNSLSYALSAGAQFRVSKEVRLGAFYSCLYTRSQPELGLIKVGASWAPLLDAKNPTLFLLDLSLPPGGVYRLQVGIEQSFLKVLTLRAGHQWEFLDNSIGGLRGLSAGLGAGFDDLSLDCSFSPNGDLGDYRSLSLTYRFPSPPPKPVSFKPSADPSSALLVTEVEVEFEVPEGPAPRTPLSPASQARLEELGRKVQTHPGNLAAWREMAMLYWRSGQADYAVQCFEEVLRLDPSDTRLGTWLEAYRKLHPPPGE